MNWLKIIRKWPIEKKRIFSISVAVFLTILIIVLNSAINIIWKDDVPKNNYVQKEAINSIKESFSDILNTAAPALEQVFGSTTEIIDQIKLASTSSSTLQ